MKAVANVVLFVFFCLVKSGVTSKNLTLIGCNLSDLGSEQLKSITELYAVHCNIPQVTNAVFLRRNQLTVLEISDSKISELHDFALNGLDSLKILNLARNNISEVKSWSNADLITVVSLDLRRNAIKYIIAESFKRFPNLQKLNLAVNLIETIGYGVLKSMPQLKYINLGSNFLKVIDLYTFRGLHKLSTLALHNNEIQQINPQAFDTNNHLRSLRLESNDLTDLEFMQFMNLARLVHLNLSKNALDSLERLAFAKDYQLKTLDVSFNLIGEIYVDTLSGLESLEMLNASHNQIHTIAAKSFLELTNLIHLDLSTNNLTHLPADVFNATRHLRYLNLSDNTLRRLDSNHFHEMEQLQQLDLSINHLHQDNFIEGLLGHRHSTLLQLDLSNNMYRVLNLSVLYEFARVDLSGNLWDCEWLIQEMFQCPATIHFGQNYTVKGKEAILSVPGVACYDGAAKRNIIILSAGWNATDRVEDSNGQKSIVLWSKVRVNRFDGKEIIIWVLIVVIVGFILVRTIQMTLQWWLIKTNREEVEPVKNKQLEMISYGDEAASLASTLEENH